jgi:AcrR family transcriptional regulator
MASMDRRRERGQRNRAALLDAALQLFEKTGYEATTVEQIAAAAGVAPRTFFHHFPSKEDVLFDGYADRLDEVAHQFRARSRSGSLWSALADAGAAVAHAIEDQPRRFLDRARLYEQVPGLRATMLRINEEWIDGMTAVVAERLGVDPRDDVHPRLVATLLNGSNRSAIEVWVAADGTADLGALIRECLELLRPTIARIERTAITTSAERAG